MGNILLMGNLQSELFSLCLYPTLLYKSLLRIRLIFACLRRFAPVVYTPEGTQMAQRLWKETMSELSFAGVEDVIEAFGG